MVKLGDIAVTANSFIPDHAVQLVETYSHVNDRSGQELKGILDTEGTKASAVPTQLSMSPWSWNAYSYKTSNLLNLVLFSRHHEFPP